MCRKWMLIYSKKFTLWSSTRLYPWPLLFLIYIKDLPNGLDFTIPCLYADDTQIFATGFDAEVLPNNMNSDLENLGDWVTVNRLQFHPLKVILQYCNAHPVLRI